MKILTLILMVALLAGCSKKSGTTADNSKTPPMPPMSEFSDSIVDMTPQVPEDPATVLIEVNGMKYTAGDADMEVKLRMSGLGGQVPPELMGRMRDKCVSEFVARAILLTEADKAKVEVTDADKKEVMEELSKRLPKDKTIEQVMRESPLGEEKMLEQITMGIRINKLLKSVFTNESSVSEQEITDYMDQNKETLMMPETVTAKHILVKTETTDDEKVKTEKKARAEDIRKKLVDGADFAKTAEECSDCPSKEAGGNLGTFTRDRMVPEFANAAFSQPTNTIGPVVESPMGYHIIFVTVHNDEGMAPREDVAKFLKDRNMEKVFVAYMEKLRASADIKDRRK